MTEQRRHGGARKGAGRKPGALGVRLAVPLRLPELIVDALDREAEAREITRTEAIERALTTWLRRAGEKL